MYDFDTLVPRVNCGSEKWDAAVRAGGEEGTVPLSVADMEFRLAPEIVQELRKTVDFGVWGYTYGDESLKTSVAEWMKHRHKWNADPAWVVNTAGVVPALYSAVRSFTQPGDRVLIQPPVYAPFSHAIQRTGRTVLENPLCKKEGRYQIDFDDLRRKAPLASMMILCSPHNPVGRVWTREELQQIAEICYENKVILFADEIHCDIIMPGNCFVPYGTLDEKYQNNCIIGTAASKTFSLAGLSCSSILVPDTGLRKKFAEGLDRDAAQFNSTFGYVATKAAYSKAEPWLDAMILYVQDNYKMLKNFLADKIPGVKLLPLEGTYLAWVDFSCFEMNDAQLQSFFEKDAKLFLITGSMFGTGGSGHARINLACPRHVLQEALARLGEAVIIAELRVN